MKIVTLDFETYYDKEYTLSKLTTESYVRDPRFEVHGCAIREHDGNTQWLYTAEHLRWLPEIIHAHDAVLCHHAQFDGFILSVHYDVRPRVWLDTLGMARLCLGSHLSVSLDNLAKHFDLAAKTVPYNAFKGKHWNELDPSTQVSVANGGRWDVELTWQLFVRLLPFVPSEELRLIDLTIRMFTEPVLRGDVPTLSEVWATEDARKKILMLQLNVTRDELLSSEKFATLLRAEGIEPPMKDTSAGRTYCFARTDKFMQEELLEHGDDRIRTLAEARLGVQSTIEQTRAERLGRMAQRGAMPVYLSYCGAHTTRWSGGDKVNWQNFKRGSRIRAAIRPSDTGHRLIKVDKSQVECRYLNFLAGQFDVIERFRSKQDPYIVLASSAYGHDVYNPEPGDPRYDEMKQKRGTGKQLELSCGYGAGAQTIQATAAKGTYGPPIKIDIETAQRWRDLYRKTHPRVVQFWHAAEQQLEKLAKGESGTWSIFRYENGRVYLPNGAPLIYADLEYASFDDGTACWRYRNRYGWRRIWGGFLVENLIQAVSRVDIGQCMLRLQDRGYKIVLMEHDAIATVVKAETAEYDLGVILDEMRRAPDWLPDIPLDAEGSVRETYS